MANRYVDNATPGGNVSGYTSWGNAALSIASLDAVDTAGDIIYLSSAHSESLTSSTYQLAWAGTPASPQLFLSVTNATPPATLTFGAKISFARTSISEHEWRGVNYTHGVHFEFAGGAARNALRINPIGGPITFVNSRFDATNTAAGWVVRSSSGFGIAGTIVFKNCDFKFASSGHYLLTESPTTISGGSILSGGTSPSTFCQASGIGTITIENFDFSNADNGVNIFSMNSSSGPRAIIRNSKLPASWSGSLVSGGRPSYPGARAEMHNCDSADTNYRLWVEDYSGYIVSDTGVYNDAGATDGTTRLSWKMVSSANAEYPLLVLESPEIVRWNDTTGSSITCTVEIVHNSQGSGTNGVLNDDECWLEVTYLGTSGYPLGSSISDCKADLFASASAQTTSSASWTGDSAGWDTQKLSVTFTPQEKGFIHARVVLAKASATVYVDPLLTVS